MIENTKDFTRKLNKTPKFTQAIHYKILIRNAIKGSKGRCLGIFGVWCVLKFQQQKTKLFETFWILDY